MLPGFIDYIFHGLQTYFDTEGQTLFDLTPAYSEELVVPIIQCVYWIMVKLLNAIAVLIVSILQYILYSRSYIITHNISGISSIIGQLHIAEHSCPY